MKRMRLKNDLTVNEHTNTRDPSGYGKPLTVVPKGTEGEMYVSPDQSNLWFDWHDPKANQNVYPYGRHHGKVQGVVVPYSCNGYRYDKYMEVVPE